MAYYWFCISGVWYKREVSTMTVEHCLLALGREQALEDEDWLEALLTDVLYLMKGDEDEN